MKFSKLFMVVSVALAMSACAKDVNRATYGGLGGAALGAGLGAIVGSQSGHAGEGVAIGAALGGISGTAIGNAQDRQDLQDEELRELQIRQEEEILRQRREIEALKRQQRYDDSYRKY